MRLPFIIALLLLPVLLISCGVSSKLYGDTNALVGGNCVLEKDIDLSGKEIVLMKASSFNMDGHIIRNGQIICVKETSFNDGSFENVSIIASAPIKIKDCFVSNPLRRVFLYCPDDKREKGIPIQIRNCTFNDMGSGVLQDGSTIAALYLQSVSRALIENCKFTNTSTLYKQILMQQYKIDLYEL